MDVYRAAEDPGHTWMPNGATHNPNLSHEAVGLLGRLLSAGERFATVRDVVDWEGRGDYDVAEDAARELESEGYLRYVGGTLEVWALPFGWQAADTLTDDGRALLAAVAESSEPIGMFDARDAVLARPAKRDARTREHRLWTERSEVLFEAWHGLWERALIWEAVPADGEHGSRCAITPIGRYALAVLNASEGRGDG